VTAQGAAEVKGGVPAERTLDGGMIETLEWETSLGGPERVNGVRAERTLKVRHQ